MVSLPPVAMLIRNTLYVLGHSRPYGVIFVRSTAQVQAYITCHVFKLCALIGKAIVEYQDKDMNI